MNDSLFPLSPTEFVAFVDERMPNSFPPLSPEELDYAELVSKSDLLTEHYFAAFQALAQFLAVVDRLHLEAKALREGVEK